MKMTFGGNENPGELRSAKAYDDGMNAKYAGAIITTNTHAAGTPEYDAWRRGWRLYTSGGTTVQHGHGAHSAAYTAPLITVTPLDTDDFSGLDFGFALYESELPGAYHFGDGTPAVMSETGEVASHSFPEGGTYMVRFQILGAFASEAEVIVTHKTTTVPATNAFSSGTSTVAATYQENGVAIESKSVAAVSSDTDVFTVETPINTDAGGLATFTLTKVAAGTATLTVTAASGPSAVCTVTVT